MFTPLRGRSVIVTGSSKGIGRGIALRFGLAGCKLLVVSRKLEESKAVAAEIVVAGGEAVSYTHLSTHGATFRLRCSARFWARAYSSSSSPIAK